MYKKMILHDFLALWELESWPYAFKSTLTEDKSDCSDHSFQKERETTMCNDVASWISQLNMLQISCKDMNLNSKPLTVFSNNHLFQHTNNYKAHNSLCEMMKLCLTEKKEEKKRYWGGIHLGTLLTPKECIGVSYKN